MAVTLYCMTCPIEKSPALVKCNVTTYCVVDSNVMPCSNIGIGIGSHFVILWFFCVMEVHVSVCRSNMLECGMLERDTRALRRRSVVLCKQLVVDELLIQSLLADDILTESMAESIMVCEY